MHDIMQPPGDGGQYVTGYGKDGRPVSSKTEPNQPDDEGLQALEPGLPDPYSQDGPIEDGSPDQTPRRSQPGSGPPPIASPDGFAYASLFLSLVWLVGLGSLLGVIFGHISRMRAKRNGLERSGLATAGTVLGWVGLAVTVLVIPMGFI